MTTNQKKGALAAVAALLIGGVALFFTTSEVTFLPGGPMAERDGLKAVLYTANYGAHLRAYVFHDLADLRTVTMSETVPANDARAQFVENKLIIAGSNQIKEFTMDETDTWMKSGEFTFPTNNVLNPAILRTEDNHVVVAVYEHEVNTVFHLAVRRPSVPPVPGVVPTPQWWHGKFQMNPSLPSGIPSKMIALVQDANGCINLFTSRDSGHSIGRAKFKLENGQAIQTYWTNMFLSGYGHPGRDGLATPNGEFPWVAATREGNRIILSYCNHVQMFGCNEIQNQVAVVAVNPDDSWQLLYDVPLPTLKQVVGSPIFIWPGGVTVAVNAQNPDCSYSYQIASQYTGQPAWIENEKLTVDDYATSPAWSTDGYLFRRVTDFGYQLSKIALPEAKLSIVLGEGVVVLTWEAVGYGLMSSPNMQTWTPIAGTSPVTLPLQPGPQFFRLQK